MELAVTMVRSVAGVQTSAPGVSKELFQVTTTHVMNREIIPG